MITPTPPSPSSQSPSGSSYQAEMINQCCYPQTDLHYPVGKIRASVSASRKECGLSGISPSCKTRMAPSGSCDIHRILARLRIHNAPDGYRGSMLHQQSITNSFPLEMEGIEPIDDNFILFQNMHFVCLKSGW